ncbi:hypothetical protein BSKO_10586 [Bryopsis sp. KO-2023]|nr:hypothetical protein BSKO_10586 [Bryopsis sp. KO-2023]
MPGSRVSVWSGVALHVGLSKNNGVLVFVFTSDEDPRSALQGSGATLQSPQWLSELSDGSAVKVYSGFLRKFEHFERNALCSSTGICEEIFKAGCSDPPRRVICTGHGVGGALSILCAAWSAIRFPTSDVRCITFGAPRLGNDNFNVLFNVMVGITYRVVHCRDELFRSQRTYLQQDVGSLILIGDEKGATIATVNQSRRAYAVAFLGEVALQNIPSLVEKQHIATGKCGNQRFDFDDDVDLSDDAFSSAISLLFAGKVLNVVNIAGQAYRGEDVFSTATGVRKRKLMASSYGSEVASACANASPRTGAVWAAMRFPEADIRCITCGSPRVGNCKFRDAFKHFVGSSFRLIHNRDPIPFIPTPLFYRHVDNPFFLRNNAVRLGGRPWYILFPKAGDHRWKHYREYVLNSSASCGLATTLARVQKRANEARQHRDKESAAMAIVSDS